MKSWRLIGQTFSRCQMQLQQQAILQDDWRCLEGPAETGYEYWDCKNGIASSSPRLTSSSLTLARLTAVRCRAPAQFTVGTVILDPANAPSVPRGGDRQCLLPNFAPITVPVTTVPCRYRARSIGMRNNSPGGGRRTGRRLRNRRFQARHSVPVTHETGTIGLLARNVPSVTSAISARTRSTYSGRRVGLRDDARPVRTPRQVHDFEVFSRLRHHAVIRRHHQEAHVDPVAPATCS